jgi:hypothetical protein
LSHIGWRKRVANQLSDRKGTPGWDEATQTAAGSVLPSLARNVYIARTVANPQVAKDIEQLLD